MKKVGKSLALIIAIILCLSMLAACGPTSSNAGGGGGTPSGAGMPSGIGAGNSPSGSGSGTTTGGGTTAGGNEDKKDEVRYDPFIPGRVLPTNSIYGDSLWPMTDGYTPPPAGAKLAEEITVIADNAAPVNDSMFMPGSTPPTGHAQRMIYNSLYVPTGRAGEYDPELVTEKITDDYKTFIFKLREDAYFTNGENLTAHDVVFTCKKGWDSPGSTAYNLWNRFEEVEAIDDYTVKLVAKQVTVVMEHYFANSVSGGSGIVSEKACTEDPVNGWKIGSGPFMWEEFISGISWTVVRNEDYWGPMAFTKKVHYLYIPEVATRGVMMLNGEAQYAINVSSEDMPMFENDPRFNLEDRVLNNVISLAFNFTNPICADLNFRLACATALVREEIALGAYGNYAVPYPDGAWWSPFQEFKNYDVPPIPEDKELSKKYLADSIYNGEVLEIACSSTGHFKGAELVAQQLLEAGINCQAKYIDPVAMTEYTKWDNNQSDMVFGLQALTTSAVGVHGPLTPKTPQNIAHYDNPEVTDLLTRAAAETDRSKREVLYKELQMMIREEIPYFGTYIKRDAAVAVAGMGGVIWGNDNTHDFRYAYVVLD